MATLIFYEKPGCITNTKQKKYLLSLGIQMETKSLLEEAWTPETLRPFFGNLDTSDWFNQNAPDIKNGSIDFSSFDEQQALTKMTEQPILIRRPLMRFGEKFWCGFNLQEISEKIGKPLQNTTNDLSESCSNAKAGQICP